MHCPTCGVEIRSSARFCSGCGGRLDLPVAQPAAPPSPRPAVTPAQPPIVTNEQPQPLSLALAKPYILSDTSSAPPAAQPAGPGGYILVMLFGAIRIAFQLAVFIFRTTIEVLFAVFRAFF